MADSNEIQDGATHRVNAGELRGFVERFERLDIAKKDLAAQQKEILTQASDEGYDSKVIRKIVALRKRDRDDIAEEEAMMEMYKQALGM